MMTKAEQYGPILNHTQFEVKYTSHQTQPTTYHAIQTRKTPTI
jgi:hypothetical protein